MSFNKLFPEENSYALTFNGREYAFPIPESPPPSAPKNSPPPLPIKLPVRRVIAPEKLGLKIIDQGTLGDTMNSEFFHEDNAEEESTDIENDDDDLILTPITPVVSLVQAPKKRTFATMNASNSVQFWKNRVTDIERKMEACKKERDEWWKKGMEIAKKLDDEKNVTEFFRNKLETLEKTFQHEKNENVELKTKMMANEKEICYKKSRKWDEEKKEMQELHATEWETAQESFAESRKQYIQQIKNLERQVRNEQRERQAELEHHNALQFEQLFKLTAQDEKIKRLKKKQGKTF